MHDWRWFGVGIGLANNGHVDVPRTRPPQRLRRPLVLAAAGAAVLIGVTVGIGGLSRAAPVIDRASVRIDEVKRGPMVRSIRAPGTLVPVNVRWLTAQTAGRVERLHVRRGAPVSPSDVVLELANPDVDLQALESERQLASAEAELVQLRTQLGTDRLAQESALETLRAERAEARRQAAVVASLLAKGHLSELEAARAREKAEELDARVALEARRLKVIGAGLADRVAAQRQQIEKLERIVRFRRDQIAAQKVAAGADGVVQELPLELGQWVVPGQLLAKVAAPGALRADLRVSETLAGEIAPGHDAEIDTRNGVVRGRVTRIAPAASQGTVTVEVELLDPLPQGARPDLSVDGVVLLERLDDVLQVSRPAHAQPGATVELYRLAPDGGTAERVRVKLGRTSATVVELTDGLAEGDRVVLSDVPGAEGAAKVRMR
jgi:multidrug efflux pump subunit AcrA (membrane-fusion protein)